MGTRRIGQSSKHGTSRATAVLAADCGTYALVLRGASQGNVRIGNAGSMQTQNGYYVYVGSAFGPGGVRGRLKHHLQVSAHPHWHIDYLRPAIALDAVWYSYDVERWEHQWANALKDLPGSLIPLMGFGASDCRCESHLFFYNTRPALNVFRRTLTNSTTVELTVRELSLMG